MAADLVLEKLQAALRGLQAQDLASVERLCGEVLREAPDDFRALHLLGVARLAAGNPQQAVDLIGRALERAGGNPAMLEHLGVARLALRDYFLAETAFRQALAQGAAHGQLYMRLGIALASQGKLAEALAALREAAVRAPDDPDVQLNLGNTLAEAGHADEAIGCYRRVLELAPRHAGALYNVGTLYRRLGRFAEAAAALEEAAAAAPEDADAHNNLGIVYYEQRRFEDAATCFERALALQPGHVHARNNLGNVLRAQGRLEEAIACYERALAEAPDHVDAYINLGVARAEQGRYREAQALYEQALNREPQSFDAHYNLGRLMALQGKLLDAVDQYRRALAANPARAIGHSALGDVYSQLGEAERAIACQRKAIELEPENPAWHFGLAESLKLQAELPAAIESYERALALAPEHAGALGGLVHVRQHACRWERIEELWERLRAQIAAGRGAEVSPFALLSTPASSAEQLACARAWAQKAVGRLRAEGEPGFDFSGRSRGKRLRVGYLSWGFHRHATAHLTAELFERHDRARFRIAAYDLGHDDASSVRSRIRQACERFVDLSRASHEQGARAIYEDETDILVDLTGYTLGARPQILALRPAPVQVNWLGYPGTLGADWYDYIVADPVLIAPEEEHLYAEQVVRLPHCYQVNDRRREVAERTPSREEAGLPPEGFVFCCFNHAYKILPQMFGVWMRILAAVPGAVLWLADSNPWASESLRREAAARGIAPERLVFASRKPLADYLVQYRLADLALDTFPYTSHTLASDALWMGCPLATCAGETFASRVAASILQAAGLSELVASSFEEYERLVVGLATDRARLEAIRRRLRENRDRCPLFDTERFARDLERIYEELFEAWCSGRARGGARS